MADASLCDKEKTKLKLIGDPGNVVIREQPVHDTGHTGGKAGRCKSTAFSESGLCSNSEFKLRVTF